MSQRPQRTSQKVVPSGQKVGTPGSKKFGRSPLQIDKKLFDDLPDSRGSNDPGSRQPGDESMTADRGVRVLVRNIHAIGFCHAPMLDPHLTKPMRPYG